MPSPNTITRLVDTFDFTEGAPVFESGTTYPSGMLFTDTRFWIYPENSTTPGVRPMIKVTINYTGTTEIIKVCFLDGINAVSFGLDPQGPFVPSMTSRPTSIKLVENNRFVSRNVFYVNLFAYGVTSPLQIFVSVGDRSKRTITLGVTYDCDYQMYDYDVKFHPYSAYDSAYTSPYKTTLTSYTPIQDWTVGTRVYTDKLARNLALPYYYYVNATNQIIKVGGPFKRYYGSQMYYKIKKERYTNYVDVKKLFIGPQSWLRIYQYGGLEYSDSVSCIEPFMSKLGEITQITSPSSWEQPQNYRYLVGSSPVNFPSANEVFSVWNWNRMRNEPVCGERDCYNKLLKGVIEGVEINGTQISASDAEFIDIGFWGNAADFCSDAVDFLGPIAATTCTAALASNILTNGPSSELQQVACPTSATADPNNIIVVPIYGPPNRLTGIEIACLVLLALTFLFWLFSFIFKLIGQIIYWFKKFTKYKYQSCQSYQHYYSQQAFPRVLNTFYTNIAKTILVPSTQKWTDGVRHYVNNSDRENNQVSYGVRRIDNQGNVTWDFPQVSTDIRTPVYTDNFYRLLFFSYYAGENLPWCGGRTIYYNRRRTYIVRAVYGPCPDKNPCLRCCDLEFCGDKEIEVEADLFWSCVSQEEADAQADIVLMQKVRWYILHFEPQPIPETFEGQIYGRIGCEFTHELKIENNPTLVGLTYDKRVSENLRVGQKVYFDEFGCNLGLSGYYALSGDTTQSQPYRTFYYVLSGVVTSIQTMESSNSTTTNTGTPIGRDNLNYSSNWYLFETDENVLSYWSNKIARDRYFNPNCLLTGHTIQLAGGANHLMTLKKGFIQTPITKVDFQNYDNFDTTSYSEAALGYYKPLIEWIVEDNFFWSRKEYRFINAVEQCGDNGLGGGFVKLYVSQTYTYESALSSVAVSFQVTIQLIYNNGNRTTQTVTFGPNQTSSVIFLGTPQTEVYLTSIIISDITGDITQQNTYFLNPGLTRTCVTSICSQTWMTTNLGVTEYQNGDPIPQVQDNIQWSNLTTGAWCWADNKPNTPLGKLYNWYAINDPRKIAPEGWKVPTISDFNEFKTCLLNTNTNNPGGLIKETTPDFWEPPNTGANNGANFFGRGSGLRDGYSGNYQGQKLKGEWWMATRNDSDTAFTFRVTNDSSTLTQQTGSNKDGFSIRCLKKP